MSVLIMDATQFLMTQINQIIYNAHAAREREKLLQGNIDALKVQVQTILRDIGDRLAVLEQGNGSLRDRVGQVAAYARRLEERVCQLEKQLSGS